MKKLLISGLFAAILSLLIITQSVFAAEGDQAIQEAIEKYKQKNYLGCISDLKMYTQKDTSNAVAWYYLGSAYMNISMKTQAHSAFDKVVLLNTVPKLTSYSIQAKMCMENKDQCTYHDFKYDDIKKLKADPLKFLTEYTNSMKTEKKEDPEVAEINKLINGNNKIHEDALKVIKERQLEIERSKINTNKAYLPSSDRQVAQAIGMLSEQNNDISAFSMMLDDNTDNNYMNLLKYYQNHEDKSEMTPEMLQLMMMSNMALPSI